ncbi:MAG: hypothetical protein CMA40_02615 [Euryarchaeota archaeon]|nr:hypothetical protein [Euryarchaeota archaeon]
MFRPVEVQAHWRRRIEDRDIGTLWIFKIRSDIVHKCLGVFIHFYRREFINLNNRIIHWNHDCTQIKLREVCVIVTITHGNVENFSAIPFRQPCVVANNIG